MNNRDQENKVLSYDANWGKGLFHVGSGKTAKPRSDFRADEKQDENLTVAGHRSVSRLKLKTRQDCVQVQEEDSDWIKVTQADSPSDNKEVMNQLHELAVTASELFRLQIGCTQPKHYLVKDKNETFVVSQEVKGYSSAFMAIALAGLEGGEEWRWPEDLTRATFFSWLYEEDDLNEGNMGVDQSKRVVRIDFERIFAPLTLGLRSNDETKLSDVLFHVALGARKDPRCILQETYKEDLEGLIVDIIRQISSDSIDQIQTKTKEILKQFFEDVHTEGFFNTERYLNWPEKIFRHLCAVDEKEFKNVFHNHFNFPLRILDGDPEVATSKLVITQAKTTEDEKEYKGCIVPKKRTDLGELHVTDFDSTMPDIKHFLPKSWFFRELQPVIESVHTARPQYFEKMYAAIMALVDSHIVALIIDARVTHAENRKQLHDFMKKNLASFLPIFLNSFPDIRKNVMFPVLYEFHSFFDNNPHYLDENPELKKTQWNAICEEAIDKFSVLFQSVEKSCVSSQDIASLKLYAEHLGDDLYQFDEIKRVYDFYSYFIWYGRPKRADAYAESVTEALVKKEIQPWMINKKAAQITANYVGFDVVTPMSFFSMPAEIVEEKESVGKKIDKIYNTLKSGQIG